MKHPILSRVLALFGFMVSLAMIPSATAATLNQGDVVITGFNVGSNTFSFLPLVDLPSGTVLIFTDTGWNGSTNAFRAIPAAGSEGILTWTAPANVAAGTHFRVTINPTFGAGVTNTSLTITNLNTSSSVTGGVITSGWHSGTNAIDPFLISGDSLIIYQDSFSNPFFLFGFNNSGTTVDAGGWNTVETPTSTTCSLPDGTGSQNALTNGVNAVGMTGGTSQSDHAEYTGAITIAPRATWLTRLATRANWTESNSTPTNTILGLALIGSPTTVTSLNRVNPATTNHSTVNWTLTFAAANTGVSASNFSLSGAAATGASVGTPTTANAGLTWNVPVTTGSTDGTLTLSLANATGTTPGVSTTLPFTTAGQSYTMDKTLPTVLSIVRQTPTSQATSSTSLTFRVTFSEAVNAPTASNFAIAAVSSSITGSIGTVTAVNASTYDVPVTITGGTGEFRLKILD